MKYFNKLSASLRALISLIGFITVAGLILLLCAVSKVFTIVLSIIIPLLCLVLPLICIYDTLKMEFEIRDRNRRFSRTKIAEMNKNVDKKKI